MSQRRWTTADLRFLRDNRHLTDAEMGEQLGCSWMAVKRARQRYGIAKGRKINKTGNPNGNIQNLTPNGGFKHLRAA